MVLNIQRNKLSNIYLLLAFGLFAGSLGPICVRFALQEGVPPDAITALRMIFACVTFAPFVWFRYREQIQQMSKQNIALALIAGGLFGLNVMLMIMSLEHVSVVMSQVLVGTNPVWVALIEVTVLKARLPRIVWIGIGIAFFGGILIAFSTTTEPAAVEGGVPALGVFLGLTSAIFAAIYLNIGRRVRADVAFVPYIWLIYTGGAITTFVITLLNSSTLLGYEPAGYFWVLMVAIVAQLIAHGAFNFVLGYLTATVISVSGQSVPILSAIWGFMIFAEVPTILQVIGGAVIIAGVLVVIRGQEKAKRKR